MGMNMRRAAVRSVRQHFLPTMGDRIPGSRRSFPDVTSRQIEPGQASPQVAGAGSRKAQNPPILPRLANHIRASPRIGSRFTLDEPSRPRGGESTSLGHARAVFRRALERGNLRQPVLNALQHLSRTVAMYRWRLTRRSVEASATSGLAPPLACWDSDPSRAS
jgi:hypothetical protein